MRFMKFIPTLAFVVAIYTVIALFFRSALETTLFEIRVPSGDIMPCSLDTLLVAASVVLLFIEILKATRTGSESIVDHILSMTVFVLALLGFLLVPHLGAPAFFLILLICLLDVIAGFTITISTARRDFSMNPGNGG